MTTQEALKLAEEALEAWNTHMAQPSGATAHIPTLLGTLAVARMNTDAALAAIRSVQDWQPIETAQAEDEANDLRAQFTAERNRRGELEAKLEYYANRMVSVSSEQDRLFKELTKERNRLDWVIKTGWRTVKTSSEGGWRMKDIHGDFRTGWYDDPRAAIDAGRKVQP